MPVSSMILAFLLVLGPLILVHEFGHFIAAKRGGIRVLEFGMGYPPRAKRLWRGKGYVVIDGQRIVIPRNFVLPWDWTIYPDKRATLTYDEVGGQAVLRSIELDPAEEEVLQNARAASLAKANVQGQNVEVVAALVQKHNVPMQRGALQLSGVIDDLDSGTEYTLNWLPIGGFVRMFGEEGLTGKGSFNDAPKRWRTITLLAGPGMNLLAALLVFVLTFTSGWPSVPMRIKEVNANSPAARAGMLPNDAIVAIGGQPTSETDQVQAYLAGSSRQPIDLVVDRNGQQFPVSLAPNGTGTGIILSDERPVMIKEIAPDSPAEKAGLQPNDLITAVAGTPLRQSGELQQQVKDHLGQSIELTISRNGQILRISLTPRTPEQTPSGQGAMGVVLNDAGYLLVPYTLGQSFRNSVDEIAGTVQQIVSLPARLLSRAIAPGDARVMGPVAISQIASASLQETLDTGQLFWILSLVAQISLALAITNLLPLPALDGGRLVFVLIEAVRRKRISPEREAIVHLIGMMLLLGLVVLITIQDIINPIIHN